MKYLVFNTEAEALEAEDKISESLGVRNQGVNAATGKEEPNVRTLRWDIPQQIADGRWVIVSPDNKGVKKGSKWFPVGNP